MPIGSCFSGLLFFAEQTYALQFPPDWYLQMGSQWIDNIPVTWVCIYLLKHYSSKVFNIIHQRFSTLTWMTKKVVVKHGGKQTEAFLSWTVGLHINSFFCCIFADWPPSSPQNECVVLWSLPLPPPLMFLTTASLPLRPVSYTVRPPSPIILPRIHLSLPMSLPSHEGAWGEHMCSTAFFFVQRQTPCLEPSQIFGSVLAVIKP